MASSPCVRIIVFSIFVLSTSVSDALVNPMLPRTAPSTFGSRGHGRIRDYNTIHINRSSVILKTNGESSPEKQNSLRCPAFLTEAVDKFKSRPKSYLLIPVVAAFVGWFTNYLAVQMIFYPVQYKGFSIWRKPEVPLGLIGWQGIVPCKTRTMSETMVTMVTSELLDVQEVFRRLDPRRVGEYLAPEVPSLINNLVEDTIPIPVGWTQKLSTSLFYSLPGRATQVISDANHRFLAGLAVGMQDNVESLWNVKNTVIDQMMQDRSKLGMLFRKCGQVELDFLTNSGLWFGFLLGLIQMVIALFWENQWAMSIGGTIVGLATNWLALKWIFEPVEPTKIGPFILQGKFLKRQMEVAKEFSQFFATKVLPSTKLWDSVLTDPSTSQSFSLLFGQNFQKFVGVVAGGFGLRLPLKLVNEISRRAVVRFPQHLHVLHPYTDKTFALQASLRTGMEHMTSAKFERVLHPIFEEDELTLILAGGFLGFVAGLIQQGIETGSLARWANKTREGISNRVKKIRGDN